MREQCPFEVKMEFGLWELTEENFDFGVGGHEHSLAGRRESKSDAEAVRKTVVRRLSN